MINMTNEHFDEEQVRLQKVKDIEKKGINPFKSFNKPIKSIGQILADFDSLSKSEKTLTLAGRIMTLRMHGGSAFANLQDETGKIQLFFSKKEVGDKNYSFLKEYIDTADFISVKGTLFTTKKGEKTLMVKSFELLTKTILTLPAKWHGLVDTEIRYRKRYLDLISNPEVKAIFYKRSMIVKALRDFFYNKGYIEVETPALQPVYGGGIANPFVTHHKALDIPLYLRISDEMYLKRLLVGGYEKVFELCKDFRNEGISYKHNPEFTMIEAQTAYTDYKDGMDLLEECYEYVCKQVNKSLEVEYQGKKISFKRPWKKMTMNEAVVKKTGFDYFKMQSLADAKKQAEKLGLDKAEIKKLDSIGSVLAYVFEEKVEEDLIQPTIIYDHPIETSPLAKKCPDDPRFVQRFEHFIIGQEAGNHYTEMNDPIDLEKRLIEEQKIAKKEGRDVHPIDDDFVQAMKHGFPPACGIGIGVDRLIMLLTNTKSIKEVILFPTLKPKKDASSSSK